MKYQNAVLTDFKRKFILLLLQSSGSPLKLLQAILTLRLAKLRSAQGFPKTAAGH